MKLFKINKKTKEKISVSMMTLGAICFFISILSITPDDYSGFWLGMMFMAITYAGYRGFMGKLVNL